MSHSSSEGDKDASAKNLVGSPLIDEGSSGGSMADRGSPDLKKGPWTSAEDAILIEYVKKHGDRNWNALQKNAGLSRCGKSCRLRWANHLRPNLKKETITSEEEKKIVELHFMMGNKWARMATHLPGRTDNELKNYWNTRIKRCKRAGVPLYPPGLTFPSRAGVPLYSPDLTFPSSDANQDQNFGGFNNADRMQNDLPELTFNDFKAFPETSSFSEILNQGLGSQSYGFNNPATYSDLLPMYPASYSNELPAFQYPDLVPCEGSIPGSHALINEDFSYSGPELPSIQRTLMDPSSSFAYAPPSPLEDFDAYIQTPPTVPVQSEWSLPLNNGLLESLVHESQARVSGNKQLFDKSSNPSATTPANYFDDGMAWESWDPITPLGCSASCVFSEYTPPINGSSFDDFTPTG